jgi:peptide-methionine (R)-S-oxide reductase
MKTMLNILFIALLSQSCAQNIKQSEEASNSFPDSLKIKKTDEEWRKILPKEVYDVTRKSGTECAGTDKFKNNKEEGIYHCYCCDLALFSSEHKFNSGTGWPSYFQVYEKRNVQMRVLSKAVKCCVEVLTQPKLFLLVISKYTILKERNFEKK